MPQSLFLNSSPIHIQNVPLDIENICLIYVVYLLKRIRLLYRKIIIPKVILLYVRGKNDISHLGPN